MEPGSPTMSEQSEPSHPRWHSHCPRTQTPWPLQKCRSAQEDMEWMREDRQVLQHCAGATGTSSASGVILHQASCVLSVNTRGHLRHRP